MQIAGGQQRIVQLVGVARVGSLFVAHALDGSLVEHSRTSGRYHVRAALLEWCIIEKRERRGVEDVVRQRRWLDSVAGDAFDLSAVDAAEDAGEAFEVHRLFQAVVKRLFGARMIGQ